MNESPDWSFTSTSVWQRRAPRCRCCAGLAGELAPPGRGKSWPRRRSLTAPPLWCIPMHSVDKGKHVKGLRGRQLMSRILGWRMLETVEFSYSRVKGEKFCLEWLLGFNDSPVLNLKALSCTCCSLFLAPRRPWTAELRATFRTDQERSPSRIETGMFLDF